MQHWAHFSRLQPQWQGRSSPGRRGPRAEPGPGATPTRSAAAVSRDDRNPSPARRHWQARCRDASHATRARSNVAPTVAPWLPVFHVSGLRRAQSGLSFQPAGVRSVPLSGRARDEGAHQRVAPAHAAGPRSRPPQADAKLTPTRSRAPSRTSEPGPGLPCVNRRWIMLSPCPSSARGVRGRLPHCHTLSQPAGARVLGRYILLRNAQLIIRRRGAAALLEIETAAHAPGQPTRYENNRRGSHVKAATLCHMGQYSAACRTSRASAVAAKSLSVSSEVAGG